MEETLEVEKHIPQELTSCNERLTWDARLTQLRSPDNLDCCFMAVLSWRKPLRSRIMRKFWSNTCERTQGNEKDACSTSQGEDSSCPKAIEVMLRETSRKRYPDPENIDTPMIALQDSEVRQSGRVLELQNRDLWTRPTDLSWHFLILVTTRELPFKNYRRRSLAKLEARDEAKKHKTLKNRKEEWDSARWK